MVVGVAVVKIGVLVLGDDAEASEKKKNDPEVVAGVVVMVENRGVVEVVVVS